MERYFIKTNKYAVKERPLSSGKVYDVVFRVVDLTGKTTQKYLCGYQSKKEANRAYMDFVAKYCDPLPADFQVKQKSATIRESYAAYIKAKAPQLRESTVVAIDNAFRKHVLPLIGDKPVNELKTADARIFLDALCAKRQDNGKPYSQAYIANVRGFVYAFYEWLGDRYDVANPFVHAKLPRGSKSREKTKLEFWERDEFERFIDVVDDDTYRALFSTLFYAGCRKGEAFALSVDDYKNGSLRVNKTVTRRTTDGSVYHITPRKNGAEYSVPVCAPLSAALEQYIMSGHGGGTFLFGGDAPMAPTTVQTKFDKYIEASGVRRIKMHGLRHSFVSLCIHHGANYMVVADLIGDTPAQVLETYGHMWDSDKRSVIDSIK